MTMGVGSVPATVAEVTPDATGIAPKPRRSPFDYTAGNRQMMKEYGMTEEEFAKHFGGRPHQQRQSPVSMYDLKRLKIPNTHWHYCSHKALPVWMCTERQHRAGIQVLTDPLCKHFAHELELCNVAESVRQNQVMSIKRSAEQTYTNQDKNWLFNDPNYGHMIWRSRYSYNSLKGMFAMGGSSAHLDPPRHELTREQNPRYNADVVRQTPHPLYHQHMTYIAKHHSFNWYWNKHAQRSPTSLLWGRSELEVQPFDPRKQNGGMKAW